MSLLVNPLISYAEMLLPLPESRDLWMAEDAEQWKSIYLQQPDRPDVAPSLVNLLQHPLELSNLPQCFDLHFAALIVLHGLWGIIWEYTQLTSALVNRAGQGNAAMVLHHQDICQILANLRMAIFEVEELQSPEVCLMLELLTMYLHVSLERIQLFAGKEDMEEARRVLPSLQEWATLPSARQAICNAGQVLHAAKAFPPKQLGNFYAVAVYHASLTCWAYGLLSQKKLSRESESAATPTPPRAVWLDGPDITDFGRFIAMGRGTPSIGPMPNAESSASGLVPLSDPVSVMGVVLGILRNNTPSPKSTPLVENLVQLMLDLGEAGSSVVNST